MSYQSFPSMYEDHDKKSKKNWVNIRIALSGLILLIGIILIIKAVVSMEEIKKTDENGNSTVQTKFTNNGKTLLIVGIIMAFLPFILSIIMLI